MLKGKKSRGRRTGPSVKKEKPCRTAESAHFAWLSQSLCPAMVMSVLCWTCRGIYLEEGGGEFVPN